MDLYAIFTLDLVIKTHCCADNCYLEKCCILVELCTPRALTDFLPYLLPPCHSLGCV